LPRNGFHLGDVLREVDDHQNRLFGRMLVIEVIDILLDLETVVRDRFTTLTERFF
jgi:hypothetical protein